MPHDLLAQFKSDVVINFDEYSDDKISRAVLDSTEGRYVKTLD
jgi:hypothetical protein